MGTYEEVVALINTDDDIPRSQIVEWTQSGDIKVLGALYKLTGSAYYRIKPELGMVTTCDFMLDYYLKCIAKDPPSGEYLFGRYQAGLVMSAWIKHLWNKRPQTEKVLEKVRDALAELYLCGDPEVQVCIVYAVLENTFADEDMRYLFRGWKKKPYLQDAYDTAVGYASKSSQEIPKDILQSLLGKGMPEGGSQK